MMRTSSSDNSTASSSAQNSNETNGKKLSEKFKDMGAKLKFNIPTKFLKKRESGDETNNMKFSESQTEQEDSDQFHLEAIDRTAIRESDELFQDCAHFIQSADRTIQLAQKANSTGALLKLSSSLNKWRVKGKGNKLYGQYESLLTRCDETEKHLKEFTDRSLNECASLMIQASYLRSRLTACVQFNEKAVELIKPKVESVRKYIEELENCRQQVETMLVFHDEVKKLKDSQVEPYIPWAMRAAMAATTPQIQCITFNTATLEKRINNINHVLGTLEKIIQRDTKLYDKRVNDLSHCKRSLAAMEKLLTKLQAYKTIVSETNEKKSKQVAITKENPIFAAMKRDNVQENETSQENAEDTQHNSEDEDNNDRPLVDEDHLPPVEFYDHSSCADCSCVISLGNDCSMNLAAVQHFAEDSTTRLHRLFSTRESVKDKARELENIEWGENI